MKFKSLLLVVAFIPTMVMAQVHVIAPLVGPGTPSAGIPGANGGGVKPSVAPLAVKPTPPQPKLPVEGIATLKSNCDNPENCSQYLNMILNKP